MGNNRSSVSHTIRVPGYKYDVLKGELRKGSVISKQIHPVPEVEEFKQRLLKRKLLKDMGTHWVLNKNLRTGHLMALNLHEGQLIKESPYKQDIIVSQTDAEELKDKLPEKNICVTDSEIVMKSIRDTLRFSSVSIMEVNADIFTHHEADTFGKEESFVLKISDENVTLLTPDFAWARSLCSEVIVCEKSGCGAIGFSFKSVTYRCGCNAFGWKSDCTAMVFSPDFGGVIQFHVKPQKRGSKALHYLVAGSLPTGVCCSIL